MTKFSGSKRRPLRINLTGADPHGSNAHAHARGRRGVHARRRVGPVPARGDEHGGRGHVLRARRRARRALRRSSCARSRRRTRRSSRASCRVPARHDADALGRDRHGRRVRRRGRRERPRRDRCRAPAADEPAEMLGYWLTTHGRNVPMPVKRGVADAARRLYTERAALRYDGLSRQIRMADVIELAHPSPRDDAQSALFRWLLDRRHHDDARADADGPAGPGCRRGARRDRGRRAARGAARARFGRARRRRFLVGAAVGLAAGRHGRRGVGGGHPVDGRDGTRAEPAQLRPGRHRRGGDRRE